ncbi:MAG TPA: GNAT family N-acyltransferase [Acidobacteriaceae bacterium]|nr:GNAT family N-acyltransferase [Acidobacteriaceae bacterium]
MADPPAPHTSATRQPICLTSPLPSISIELGKYQVRLADSLAEREAACRLRFKVFNIELGEGLASSYETGLDHDQFDLFCDHLIVEDRSRRQIVGTYRMQSGITAAHNLGYYSEQEFDFAPYESIRGQILELGRASIDREHRSSEVLTLLWRGIVAGARSYRLRYLIGCSSLNSRDPRDGWSTLAQLTPFLAPEPLRTRPTPAFALPPAEPGPAPLTRVPKLLRTYIAVGARICGAPAWDREFGTFDFLTLLDLTQLSPAARNRFLPNGVPDSPASSESCVPLSVSWLSLSASPGSPCASCFSPFAAARASTSMIAPAGCISPAEPSCAVSVSASSAAVSAPLTDSSAPTTSAISISPSTLPVCPASSSPK